MELSWHPYRYYPYERELALREVLALLSPAALVEEPQCIRLENPRNTPLAERLVYFSKILDGGSERPTLQAKLERLNGNGLNRQSTRYSVHGLHEYKGKFNPQIARAILNILQVSSEAYVLDPFCGSGTSLVECCHLGINAVGADVNPLAIFVANAKLSALQVSASILRAGMKASLRRYKTLRPMHASLNEERRLYLERWFAPKVLEEVERLRSAIESGGPSCAPVLLSIASNLLRSYSLQDPNDLRIRRRKDSLPEKPFVEAYEEAANAFISRLEAAQQVLGEKPSMSRALLLDSRHLRLGSKKLEGRKFDCALTSPPYAMALPYIDTQRLSLVWLNLLPPSEILKLEARLVGSREIRGENKQSLSEALRENYSQLPKEQAEYCLHLQSAVSDSDGFRRRAVPVLLYRYFSGMQETLRAMRGCMRKRAPFALIVGSNHTVLGGERFDIDTPTHLAQIARSCGWDHEETMSLQTYHRYGYHMNNAVTSESLIILRAT